MHESLTTLLFQTLLVLFVALIVSGCSASPDVDASGLYRAELKAREATNAFTEQLFTALSTAMKSKDTSG